MNSTENKPSELIDLFWESIENIRTGFFITETPDGMLRGRPMETQKIERPDALWFLSDIDDGKSRELLHNKRVCVCYDDKESGLFISTSGIAQMSLDSGTAEELIEKGEGDAQKWVDDDQLLHTAVISVTLKAGEIWRTEEKGGAMTSVVVSGIGTLAEKVGLNHLSETLSPEEEQSEDGIHEQIQFTR